MTKLDLYRKLIDLYRNHRLKNTKVNTYIDNVIKAVKEYLEE